ncbi:MAG TPA: DUF5752 family protein [Burkholderiales bacterium]|nr:DUF5752 family protein [Burkholderiales bacterium]
MGKSSNIEPFVVRDCTLAAIATGRRAQNLRELRDQLQVVHPGSIYYHFWGSLLRPDFDDPEYNNDFASWARHALHDTKLAEQLGIIDPADYPDIEGLRQELIDIIEQRLDETEFLTWARRDQQFHFVRSQIIVFDTGRRFSTPQELTTAVPTLSLGSIYYHVIDARRREPLWVDDFRAWLERFGGSYADVCQQLAELDPYFTTLADLRVELANIMNKRQPVEVIA